MKNKIRFKSLLLFIAFALAMTTCQKGGDDGPDDDGKKTTSEKEARAEHNNKKLQGVGNVYIAEKLATTQKQQLYAKVDYAEDNLAYYVSPTSENDIGTDHRVVYGASDAAQQIVEMDEQERSIRFYTAHNGTRSPLLLDIAQYGTKQYELKLFHVDWEKTTQNLIGSVYLRNGESIALHKQASTRGGAKMAATSTAALGFLGCQRPDNQQTPAATVGAYLQYMQCSLAPLLKNPGGAGELAESIRESQQYGMLYAELLRDMEYLSENLGNMGKFFSSFKTDPLAANDPMKTFSWYNSKANTDKAIADVQLSFLPKVSTLEYDETNANSSLKVLVQVEDKAKKALVGQALFVDFKVELEQAGKLHVLLEETKSSAINDGQVELTYNFSQAAVKPKLGDKLTVAYRLSADEEGTFTKHQVKVLDRQPAKITIMSGNGQETSWKEKLKAPLVVKVTNKAGEPLENVHLQWSVQSVSWGIVVGQLSATQAQTDAKGQAKSDYLVGMQQQKPETITVKVLDKTGNVIPNLEVSFTYKLKRNNFSIVQLGYPKGPLPADTQDYDSYSIVREWKNGDNITVNNGLIFHFGLKLDGKPIGHNSSIIGTYEETRFGKVPFSKNDVVLKNLPILFSDPRNGSTDSIRINLTISNAAYRHVVGKTLKIEGRTYRHETYEDPQGTYIGEVVKIKLGADGKAQMTSKNLPKDRNGIVDWEFTVNSGYAWIKNTAEESYVRKVIVGVFNVNKGFGAYFGGGTFALLEDYSIIPWGSNYFDAYNYYQNIKSIKLE